MAKIKKKINVKKVTKKKPVKAAKKVLHKKNPAKKIVKKAVKKVTAKKIVKQKKPVAKKSKATVKKVAAKKPVASPAKEFAAESLFKARIKVIGIGGGGGSIVSEIGRSLEKATFVIADTDIRALKKKSGIKYFWFGEDLTHGLGTGVNVELGKQAAEQVKEKISSIFKDQDIVIFIASLGGGLGSGATEVFAQAAKQFGGITFGIFTMPFKFEGKIKHKIALGALKSLRENLNVSLVIPNERIFKIIDANTPIIQAFSTVNKILIDSLESLIDLIYSPGIINIDFADLRAILKGIGNTAFLNTVEESGKDRADKVCQKILINPLLQGGSFEAQKIMFNISGSENLSMFEVEKISNKIAEANPKAKIIFGISKSPKLKNKIKTTILMTGGQIRDEEFAGVLETKEVEAAKAVAETAAIQEKTAQKPSYPLARNDKLKKKEKKPAKKKIVKKKSEKKKKRAVEIKEKDDFLNPFSPAFDAPPAPVSFLAPQKALRRSGLEIKKAEELQEKKKIEQEKEWEIPAFLRRVKYNKN